MAHKYGVQVWLTSTEYYVQVRQYGPLWSRASHATRHRQGKARQHRNNATDTIDERDPEIPLRLLGAGRVLSHPPHLGISQVPAKYRRRRELDVPY
jgi:hypothetical protein